MAEAKMTTDHNEIRKWWKARGGLALLYQEKTAEGERSNFNKLVRCETAEARAARATPAGATAADPAARLLPRLGGGEPSTGRM